MSDNLLPCPFCGSDAHIQEDDDRFFAACTSCFCNVGEAYDSCAMPAHIFHTKEAAAEAWNTRSVTVGLPEWPKPL
jgi:hypothetical protein